MPTSTYQEYIDRARSKRGLIEQKMAAFDFNDPRQDRDAYEKMSREYQRLERLLQTWDQLAAANQQLADNRKMLETETDAEFLDVVRHDIAGLEEQAVRLELKLKTLVVPPDPNEDRNIILEIRPAAGGEEAALFTADLFRMYMRLAEAKGWRAETLNSTESDMGGLREVSVSLAGEDVYRYLRFESGVHRVQRVPTTEANGRIHTSTVTVTVLPEAEEVDVQIRPEDLRIDVFRSSGPGGQHVNKTDSAVRITHLPTGLAVASQREKSQHRNKDLAMRILRAQLFERLQAEEAARQSANRKSQMGSGMRSERIRTYNFPQNRVSDHRFELTFYDLTNMMEGRIEDLLEQIIGIDADRRLQEQMQAE